MDTRLHEKAACSVARRPWRRSNLPSTFGFVRDTTLAAPIPSMPFRKICIHQRDLPRRSRWDRERDPVRRGTCTQRTRLTDSINFPSLGRCRLRSKPRTLESRSREERPMTIRRSIERRRRRTVQAAQDGAPHTCGGFFAPSRTERVSGGETGRQRERNRRGVPKFRSGNTVRGKNDGMEVLTERSATTRIRRRS